MTDIPKLDRPVFAPFDLGALDADLKGTEISVLRNPTIRFRMDFVPASMDPSNSEWSDWVAAICGVKTEDLRDAIGDLEISIGRALFVTEFDSFNRETKAFEGRQDPYILRIWDNYAAEKRKAYGVRS